MMTPDRPDIRQTLEWAAQRLSTLPDPRREAEWLLMDTLSRSRAWLFSHSGDYPGPKSYQQFRDRVMRRAAGEPLAYILGHCQFRALTLHVTQHVLIPRPETEWLVDAVLKKLSVDGMSVVDLGTGSGAIALSLARERPAWQVFATDISTEALGVARHNAREAGLERVQFVAGDWFDALPRGRRFHAVISNPPYVAAGSPVLDSSVARHEPPLALYAEEQGLAALQRLIAGAAEWLWQDGWLVLEHGFDQGAAVRRVMEESGYQDIQTHRDLGGLERFTMARWRGGSLA